MIDTHLLIKGNSDDYRQGRRSLVPLLFSFVYYGYGLIVVYRYHHLGIYLVRILFSFYFNIKQYFYLIVFLVRFFTIYMFMSRSFFQYSIYCKTSIV